jgi:alcohol dehydrogenase
VIARGSEKERAAIELGAHHYINTLDENASERLKNDGGVDFIVATAPASETVSALLSALAPRGKRSCWVPDKRRCRLCRV